MQATPGGPTRSSWWWVLLGLAASCGACTLGGVVLTTLGLLSEEEGAGTAATSAASSAAAGQPGVEGGYALAPPPSFVAHGEGRWLHSQADGSATLTVELIRLPPLPDLSRAPERLVELWTTRLAADWDGASATPFVMRRFVSNGAVAHFTGAPLRTKPGGQLSFVSLYLVEAGDRLEPLVFVQQYQDPTDLPATREMLAGLSWNRSHPAVEQVLAGVKGSPVGRSLAADEEVVGRWVFGTNATAQWVHTATGSTSMTAAGYSVDFTFDEDHRYTYRFSGASGQVGALQFGSDAGEGTWHLEHDLLVLTGDTGKGKKYLVTAATRGPDGKRVLLLMGEGRYTAAPFAVAAGELFVEAR